MKNTLRNTFFDDMNNLHYNMYNKIINEWGMSSVTLKEYLQIYYNEDINYANELADIKINYILPYRKAKDGKFNGFYGQMAIDRLQLALEAKALIMTSPVYDSLEENRLGKFGYEALRLYLRVQSYTNTYKPLILFDEFNNMVKDAYNLAQNNYDEQFEKLTKLCNQLKPKKDQVLYHFTREDFEPIRYEKNLKTAYKVWIENVFPNLLDKYKERKLNEYRISLGPVTFEEWTEKQKALLVKLDKIKITPIKYIQFTKLIKKIKTGEL